jgi:excisionase family DNA binding protein
MPNQSLHKGCDQTVTYPKRPENHPNRLLRLKDAAAYLSLSPWKMRRLIWQGRLPVVQDLEGSPFLFDRHDLDAFIETHKRSSPL